MKRVFRGESLNRPEGKNGYVPPIPEEIVVRNTFSYNSNELTNPIFLSNFPDSKNLIEVYIDGVYQNAKEFDLTGNALTFNEGWPTSAQEVEVVIWGMSVIPSNISNLDAGLY